MFFVFFFIQILKNYALCAIHVSKKDKSCLLIDIIINNFCCSALATNHSPQSCNTLTQLQKRKLCFFPSSLCNLCTPNSVVWFLHRDHLHIRATQIVKVAFKLLSYLTLFPFHEVSLVFVLFFCRIIIVF